MNNGNIFVDGLIAKAPHPKAPEFVKAQLSIKREDLITWLQSQDGDWVNVDIKVGRSGKWYASVNGWKPKQGARTDAPPTGMASHPLADTPIMDDEIPF